MGALIGAISGLVGGMGRTAAMVALLSTIAAVLMAWVPWFRDFMLWFGKTIFGAVLAALAGLLSAIPVPAWLESAGDWMGAIPAGVAYFVSPLQFGTGLTIMLSAYTLRFLIRRIPVIG
jgi:hypothetical protein